MHCRDCFAPLWISWTVSQLYNHGGVSVRPDSPPSSTVQTLALSGTRHFQEKWCVLKIWLHGRNFCLVDQRSLSFSQEVWIFFDNLNHKFKTEYMKWIRYILVLGITCIFHLLTDWSSQFVELCEDLWWILSFSGSSC